MRIFRMYLFRPILIVLGLLLVGGLVRRMIFTVPGRVAQYGPVARQRLQPFFARANVPYPPRALVLVGLKDTQTLQLYAPDRHGVMRFLRAYPILAASGRLGPKLREGDLQVPEGIYRVESLNPRSLFHLSLRLDYPNAFDREMARREGRTQLGGDIMIHGAAASAGCLAMGDPASEDLFVLAADTGLPHITVILSPVDFRVHPSPAASPAWVNALYAEIRDQLRGLPLP